LICTVRLPPASTVAGSVPALAAKELSERFNFCIWIEDVPLFVIVRFWFALLPMGTSPKSTEAGFSANPPEVNGFVVTPQPKTPRPSPRAAMPPANRA
jgi:hypothetical protein